MVCVEMLLGKQDSRVEYDNLSQYIEGWLHYKENKKYERFWFVLRGNILHGRELCTAYLFCFKDLNIHVEENVIGQVEIHSHDKVELLKCGGNKPMKCDFTILLSETKFHFRADDEISRERWIYALCDLIGKCQPPSELPTERNQIRTASSSSSKKKENNKKSAFTRSRTVELPSSRRTADLRRQSTPLGPTRAGPQHLPRSQTLGSNDSPPVVPPPRSSCSLPFMLGPHIQLQDLEWFYPGMRREEAQEKISSCPVGYYLLRDSESKIGNYTLTFKDTDRVKNHMIIQSSDRQYRFHNSEVETAFPSPQKAVEFYMIKKHSKTLTPIPYCENEGDDRDYLLPSEMNVPSKPDLTQQSPQPVASSIPNRKGYTNRELPPPPPPPDAGPLRNLSIQGDDEEYLVMKNVPRYVPPQVKDKLAINDVKSEHINSNSDDANGYLKVAAGSSSSYDQTPGSPNDIESYLELIDGDACCKKADSDSDSSDPAEPFGHLPELPKKPLKSQNSINFSEYDCVNLKEYENQDIVDHAKSDAPPIPPRSSKPELLPRNGTVYRT